MPRVPDGRDRWFVLLAAVLAGFFVGLGAAAGGLYWGRVETRGEQLTRTQLPKLAAEAIPRVFGYDYQTVERSLMEAYPLFTPDYRHEFEQRATGEIIPQARQAQLVNQINVVGVGMLDAHRSSGSVLVYLNRTVTDKSKEKYYDGSRLRVDYQKIDNTWLISNILPI